METDADVDQQWQEWSIAGKPPKKLRDLVNNLQPIIDYTMRSVGSKSPVLGDRAKLVAAKAIQTFDPSKGAKLKTHVSSQLRSIVRDAPQIQEPFVPGERYRREAADLHHTGLRFIDSFGRDPSDEELSEMTQIALNKVIRIRSTSRARMPMSVMEDAGEEGNSPDIIGSVRSPHDDWTDAVYHGLGDVDRLILMHRTGYRNADILEPDALAKKVGLSPDAVRERVKRIQQQLDSFNPR